MQNRSFISLTLIGVIFLFVSSAAAQENVRITVGVVGADGAPVMTLTKPDFMVQDSGRPRTIDAFAGPTAVPVKAPELAPNEFTNATDVTESGAIFVVLDTIHTRYVDERNAREMILKFMAKAAQAKHAVTLAIMSDKGPLRVYHDYRTGPDVLLAALVKTGLGGMKGVAAPAGVNDAEVSAEAGRLSSFAKGDLSNATPQEQLLRSNIDFPLTMYQDIAHAAYGMPGRKMLVWVTNGVPFDINPKTMMFQSSQESSHGVAVNGEAAGGSKAQLNNDQVKRILPVWRKAMHDLFDGGVAVYPVEARNSWSSAGGTLTQGSMKTLAQLTGGKAYYGSNDPFPEILQMSNGNTAGYTLTYPTEATGDDFRHTEVTTSKANATVNQAPGYFPAHVLSKDNAGPELALAMQSPLEYTGIVFKLGIGAMEEGSGGKKKVNLVISMGADSGVLNEAARKVDIGLVAIATNARRETVGKMNEGAGGQFPPEAVAHIKELGFQLKRTMEIAPGDCTVHFLIRDNQTGHIGSLVFPLKVQ